MSQRPIRRALISVFDKTGLADLAIALARAGVQIVSTGSTAAACQAAGVAVVQVSEVTGFAECLDGRVKTLHPRIHAAILADLGKRDHVAQLDQLDIEPFDLVVCNLYPFADTVASGASPTEIIEQIDIGGPSMVRAAAKNHASVAVVTAVSQYEEVVRALESGGFSLADRQRLAAAAFAHTAAYDVGVATWMSQAVGGAQEPFSSWYGATFERAHVLRYGENPHQGAALYRATSGQAGIAQAQLVHGKPMSFNNYVDADAAWRAAWDHGEPAVAIIKHANPCGIATGPDIASAYRKAHACDPVSAFGGVIAANRPVDAAMARAVSEVFTEVIAATEFCQEALEILRAKKNLRVLVMPAPTAGPQVLTREISGGLLRQEADTFQAGGDDVSAWTLVSGEAADAHTLADLAFAWRAVRAVKSNAILLARAGAAVGIGMGQVNRVDSCQLAVARAGAERARGAVAASDAFFPFADGLQILLAAGVKAVVQPGGSLRDSESIAAAQAAGVTMYLTGTRHFAH